MTSSMLLEKPMAAEAAAKPTAPTRKVVRCPNRSPIFPAVIRMTALIAEVLAEREGTDPVGDLRPRLLAAVFGAVARTAQREWTATAVATQGADGGADGDVDGDGFIETLERHLDQLGPALTADWR